jgi:hypothetical protein
MLRAASHRHNTEFRTAGRLLELALLLIPRRLAARRVPDRIQRIPLRLLVDTGGIDCQYNSFAEQFDTLVLLS